MQSEKTLQKIKDKADKLAKIAEEKAAAEATAKAAAEAPAEVAQPQPAEPKEPELPSEDRKYSKLLGKNDNNISDSYFEYEKFEHFPKENSKDIELNIEWEKEYDENNDESLDIFKLTKLKYIITFDEFEYKDEENSNSEDTINQIFSKFD